MVLLNFDIHNFLKENNLGKFPNKVLLKIYSNLFSQKFLQSEDVDVKHAVK